MNSITFVVDKLTPPSSPLHHPHTSSSSTPAPPARPDSGYFSIYSSDRDDPELTSQATSLLRHRQVGNPLDAKDDYRENIHPPVPDIPSKSTITIGLKRIFAALANAFWTLLYPFAQIYSSLCRLLLRIMSRQHRHSIPSQTLPPIPATFPEITSPILYPFVHYLRPRLLAKHRLPEPIPMRIQIFRVLRQQTSATYQA